MSTMSSNEELALKIRELEEENSRLKILKAESELMQYCVDNASDAVFWVDSNANFIYANKSACQHMNRSLEELLSLKIHDVDSIYQKDNWSNFWSEFKDKGSLLFESINLAPDGKKIPVEISANYLLHEGQGIMHAYVRDITERKNNEIALQISANRFRRIFDQAADSFFIHDLNNGKFIDANRSACHGLGYTLKELQELNLSQIEISFSPEQIVEICNKIGPGEPIIAEGVHQRKDGSTFPVEISLGVLEETEPVLLLGTVRDISERIKEAAEKEKIAKKLHQAEFEIVREKLQNKVLSQNKLAALGQLATGVAHEINQPLSYIKIMLQSLLRDLKNEQINLNELADESEESIKQVSRITKIIDHLRLFGRDDGTVFENVYLKKVMENTLILLGQRMKLKNIEYIQNIQEDLPAIRGNAIQLEQVLINLFQNSIDALKGKKEKKISLWVYSERSEVKIIVTDNGEGIPVDIQEKIFEPFFTTKEPGKGTGIGLSIVYGIIKEHKGDILCVPEQEGASFQITLPHLN